MVIPPPDIIQSWALWAALAAAALVAWGEWLHARRIGRIGRLAFGPAAKPRHWTGLAAPLRVATAAGMAWGLVTLLSFDAQSRQRTSPGRVPRHLMVLLDMSPSMLLKDAGEQGSLSRKQQAADVLRSALDRAADGETLITIAGFYTEARLLVEQCRDRELIRHIAAELPYHITFHPGKTDLLGSLNQTGAMMKDWPRKSTTLLVLTDGDTVAPSGLNPMPPSVAATIVAGFGDAGRGTFIDGHISRQDSGQLSQLARRLGGGYFNCNQRHIPSEALQVLSDSGSSTARWRADRRLLALGAFSLGALVWCLLPLLLASFGSGWRHRPAAASSSPAP